MRCHGEMWRVGLSMSWKGGGKERAAVGEEICECVDRGIGK